MLNCVLQLESELQSHPPHQSRPPHLLQPLALLFPTIEHLAFQSLELKEESENENEDEDDEKRELITNNGMQQALSHSLSLPTPISISGVTLNDEQCTAVAHNFVEL